MSAEQVFSDVTEFSDLLSELHRVRRDRVVSGRKMRRPRVALKKSEREQILKKTGSRCHICGGKITSSDWQADHILAHSTGGAHQSDNYLPAHMLCNNYRWHYEPEEFQWILKLGVWLRTQIEHGKPIGLTAGQSFSNHERKRHSRRKNLLPPASGEAEVFPKRKKPSRRKGLDSCFHTVT
jgi:hypothetical protein